MTLDREPVGLDDATQDRPAARGRSRDEQIAGEDDPAPSQQHADDDQEREHEQRRRTRPATVGSAQPRTVLERLRDSSSCSGADARSTAVSPIDDRRHAQQPSVDRVAGSCGPARQG